MDKSIESFSRFGLECLLSSLFPRDRDNSMPARRANVILTPALPPPCPKKLEATFQQQGPVEDDKKGPDGREGTSVVSVPADPGPSEMEVVATSSADAGLKEAEKNVRTISSVVPTSISKQVFCGNGPVSPTPVPLYVYGIVPLTIMLILFSSPFYHISSNSLSPCMSPNSPLALSCLPHF